MIKKGTDIAHLKASSNKIKKSEMDLGLLYNPENKMGVGGLSLRFNFK